MMGKQIITITLHGKELLYDVQNTTHLVGRSHRDGNNFEQVARMQADDSDECMNALSCYLSEAFVQLRTHLSRYADGPCRVAADDVLPATERDYTLLLRMPMNYDTALGEHVAAENLMEITQAVEQRERPRRKRD